MMQTGEFEVTIICVQIVNLFNGSPSKGAESRAGFIQGSRHFFDRIHQFVMICFKKYVYSTSLCEPWKRDSPQMVISVLDLDSFNSFQATADFV